MSKGKEVREKGHTAPAHYGYGYDTPSKYRHTLAQHHALPMLALECVLSVIIQMSNKSGKHPYCANADAKSTVVSGMVISLTPYYQPAADRIVRLIETVDFNTVENMVETLNSTLSRAPDFATVPSINYANRVYYHKSGEYMQYKICPETYAEELVCAFDQSKSMIEVIGLQDDPSLEEARRSLQDVWYKLPWGKDTWTWENATQENQREWRTGSSKRAWSALAKNPRRGDKTVQERMINSSRQSFGLARPW